MVAVTRVLLLFAAIYGASRKGVKVQLSSVFSTGVDNPAGPVSVYGRGGFVTRPAFKGKDIPGNGSDRSDPFLHPSKGGLQTRPYPDDNTNTR